MIVNEFVGIDQNHLRNVKTSIKNSSQCSTNKILEKSLNLYERMRKKKRETRWNNSGK